jgi:hypothetical protein
VGDGSRVGAWSNPSGADAFAQGDVEVASGPWWRSRRVRVSSLRVLDRDDAPVAPLKVSAAVSRRRGLSGNVGALSSCASLWRPREAVCDDGNGSRGSDDPAIMCGGFAAALRRTATDFACGPRVHTSQSLTTNQQAPHHHDDAPIHDLPTTHDPPTRPTSKHAPQRPHTDTHHHHDRNP